MKWDNSWLDDFFNFANSVSWIFKSPKIRNGSLFKDYKYRDNLIEQGGVLILKPALFGQ